VVENVPSHLQIKEKLSGKTIIACHLCGEEMPLGKMRGHVGKHILFNMRNENEAVDLLNPVSLSLYYKKRKLIFLPRLVLRRVGFAGVIRLVKHNLL